MSVYAVDGVSFNIDRGEMLSLVGESGRGKSTIGRCILRLFDITAGQVNLDGRRIDDMSSGALRPLRRRIQVVFQDPFSSLNPRMRVGDILAEPIRNFGRARSVGGIGARINALLHKVRLPRGPAEGDWVIAGLQRIVGVAHEAAAETESDPVGLMQNLSWFQLQEQRRAGKAAGRSARGALGRRGGVDGREQRGILARVVVHPPACERLAFDVDWDQSAGRSVDRERGDAAPRNADQGGAKGNWLVAMERSQPVDQERSVTGSVTAEGTAVTVVHQ